MTALPAPRDVPGFAAAAAAGLTPARPAEPPEVRRPTAHEAFFRLGVTAAVAVAASIVCVFFAPLQHRLGAATLPVFLVVMIIGFCVTRPALIRFRVLFLEELQAGYSTETGLVQGLFWGNGGRDSEVTGWRWEGLWALTSDGRVLSAPDLSVDPPGVYPSPTAAGRRELWTGWVWTGAYFDHGPR